MHTSVEITKTKESVYEGNILSVSRDTAELTNGAEVTREVVNHNGGVCILALDENGDLIMVEQYRYGAKREMLELPAGKLEKGESPEACARRELEEETGYIADDLELLTYIYPSPAYCTEKIYVYIAVNLHAGTQSLDTNEFLSVRKISVEVLPQMLADADTLVDAKTRCAVTEYLLGNFVQMLEKNIPVDHVVAAKVSETDSDVSAEIPAKVYKKRGRKTNAERAAIAAANAERAARAGIPVKQKRKYVRRTPEVIAAEKARKEAIKAEIAASGRQRARRRTPEELAAAGIKSRSAKSGKSNLAAKETAVKIADVPPVVIEKPADEIVKVVKERKTRVKKSDKEAAKQVKIEEPVKRQRARRRTPEELAAAGVKSRSQKSDNIAEISKTVKTDKTEKTAVVGKPRGRRPKNAPKAEEVRVKRKYTRRAK